MGSVSNTCGEQGCERVSGHVGQHFKTFDSPHTGQGRYKVWGDGGSHEWAADKLNGKDCAKCGIPITDWTSAMEQLVEDTCFNCNFWLTIIQEKDKHMIIDGSSYCWGPAQGSGGRSFAVRDLKTGEIDRRVGLWQQGKVPIHFRDRLPNTHEFAQLTVHEM